MLHNSDQPQDWAAGIPKSHLTVSLHLLLQHGMNCSKRANSCNLVPPLDDKWVKASGTQRIWCCRHLSHLYGWLAVHAPRLTMACFLYTLLYSFCFMQKWAQFSLTPFFYFPGVVCVAKQCMAELFQGEPKFPRTTGQVRAHFRLERRIQYKIKSVRGCRSSRTASQFIIFKNYSKQKHIVILNRQTSLKNNKN